MGTINSNIKPPARKAEWILGAFIAALDVLALGLAERTASITTMLLEINVLNKPAYFEFPDIVAARTNIYIVLCLFVMGMLWQKGLYARRMPWWNQVRYLGKAMLLALLLDGFINFGLKLYQPRLLIVSSWAFAGLFLVSLRWLGFRIADRLGWWKTPTVIIGDSTTAADLIYAFSADLCAGHTVHSVFLQAGDYHDLDAENLPRGHGPVQVYSGGYETYIRENPGDFYIVCLSAMQGENHESLMALLEQMDADYAIVPSIAGVGLYRMEPHYFFGHDIMMLQARNSATAISVERIIKRAMDVGIAGAALFALAPLFAFVTLMLKLEGQGGSVFYGGLRMGYQGRFFNCWKFRSMEPDSDHLLHEYLESNPQAKADWEKYRKLSRDPRITTRTARFIRKASIDELPQLWNVLTGDMSLVGPRPILEEEQSYFGNTLKEYISVRPGLTGLWQVSGRNNTSFARRVYWDSWYVRNWSLWGDIVILVKTPLVLLTGKGAN